jgi:[calcium/calmodulin-dependent protein kinase] kinase
MKVEKWEEKDQSIYYWRHSLDRKNYNFYFLLEGKFSKVFKCTNENDKKAYAMKIVNKKKLNHSINFSKKKSYSFVETEIAILKKLDHPNVLTLYEIIDDPNIEKLYIITDFIKNGNLSERMQKPMTINDLESISEGS